MVGIKETIKYGAIRSRIDSSSKVLCRQTGQEGAIKVTHPIIHLITRKPDDFRQIELARKKRKEPENQSINELFVLFESDNCRPPCTIFEPSADGSKKIKRHLLLIFNELQITYLNVTILVTFLYFCL